MRTISLVLWLMLAVLIAAYHYGPGQRELQLDVTDGHIASAEQAAASGFWVEAEEYYDAALSALPDGNQAVDRRLRIERAKVQMMCKKLPTAHGELKSLVTELVADLDADPKLVDDACSTLANAQYYMTWLMRLEGQPKEKWEPEIEAARQSYRRLAETAAARSDEKAVEKNQQDLESAIRLARMELKDLQGLPLPSQ